MDTQTPDSSLVRFLRSKAAIPIGFVIALALGIFLMYQGIDRTCCIGALLIAMLMFFLVKLFNGKSTKILIVFGVLFFAVSTIFGAFVVSEPIISEKQNYNNFDSCNFSNLQIVYDSDNKDVTITISYSGEGTSVYTEFRPVAKIAYTTIIIGSTDDTYTHTMTEISSHVYSATFSIDSGTVYYFDFISKNNDMAEVDKSVDRIYIPDGVNKNLVLLGGNAYYSFIPAILFILIALITLWLRKRLEKERKKMEADGRLYPEGYGRCKECGSIVLPGEVSCRKCGAYIDVPENLRVKKVDSFQCSDCGAEVPGDAKVCPKCGARFDEDTETVVVENKAVENTGESFQCSDCGATVPGNATICPNCGAKFDEDDEEEKPSRFCAKCGTAVPEYAEHCHKCGAKLDKKM